MEKTDLKALFEAGAHFGHRTSRWHPKMAAYIHSTKDGVHILNLEKTVEMLQLAADFAQNTAKTGKQIMFVGTKRQAKGIIVKYAEEINMPYISVRWFGGLLTNHKTMSLRVKRLKNLEKRMESGELASRYNKLEVQRFQEEIERLQYNFGGVKDLNGLPGAIFVTDAVTDEIAIKEANRLDIPVIAIVDSNADPDRVDYPIPANDDAIKTIELITSVIANAVNSGKKSIKKPSLEKSDTKVASGLKEKISKAVDSAKKQKDTVKEKK